MTNIQTVRTVFVMNREDGWVDRIGQSAVLVGTEFSSLSNERCHDEIYDTGWYECTEPVSGDVISLKRISNENIYYNMSTLRAYDGINVA